MSIKHIIFILAGLVSLSSLNAINWRHRIHNNTRQPIEIILQSPFKNFTIKWLAPDATFPAYVGDACITKIQVRTLDNQKQGEFSIEAGDNQCADHDYSVRDIGKELQIKFANYGQK